MVWSHKMGNCCEATKQGSCPPQKQPISVEPDHPPSGSDPGSLHWLSQVPEARVSFISGLALLNYSFHGIVVK